MKKIAVLPTLLTLGNGICGLIAIVFASKILTDTGKLREYLGKMKLEVPPDIPFQPVAEAEMYFALAGWFILLGMLFDMLDGYVARLAKSASDFGGELDSLCDVVTFGIAPAFLLLKLGPGWENPFFHQLLAGIAAVYFACTALRLARFNVENTTDAASHKRFRGLPSPGAAGCIAALAILRGEFPATLDARLDAVDPETARQTIARTVEIIAPVGALIVALLMVSNVPYPHVTGKIFRGKKRIGHLIQVLLAGFILLMFRSLAPLLVFWAFAFLFPLRSLVSQRLRTDAEPEPPPVDEHAPHKL